MGTQLRPLGPVHSFAWQGPAYNDHTVWKGEAEIDNYVVTARLMYNGGQRPDGDSTFEMWVSVKQGYQLFAEYAIEDAYVHGLEGEALIARLNKLASVAYQLAFDL